MEKFTMCSRCKKRVAVMFIASSDGQSTDTKGLCLKCASEMGLKPVDDLIRQMGLTPEEAESVSDDLSMLMDDLVSDEDLAGEASALELGQGAKDEEPGEEGRFKPGGAATFPFLNKIFGNMNEKTLNNYDQNMDRDSSEEYPRHRNEEKEKESKRTQKKKEKRKFLDNYCEDLTKKAREGKLDRIIGREKEIYRAMQILNRRTKNNPCLIGEPGVGKTAIAEGIALNIAYGKVPFRLQDKEIHQLDLTALVAGTQFRGQFESRVKGLLEEVKKSGNIILFVDEVHNLVGAGESEGAMSAANIFKPALSRGEIQVIGATTFAEYRKYIERDAALERRFQPISVEEPSIDDTIAMLMGVKEYYEKHHRVQVPNKVIHSAVVLSERYINDRFLPDKAIDLLDEACSCRSLESPELTEYDTCLYKRESLRQVEEELESQQEIDYEKLANVKAQLMNLEKQATSLEGKVQNIQVTEEDVARVIELWTGISSAKIKQSELGKIAGLEEKLKKKVIGQEEACELVAAAIRRSRVQISPRRRPASFIFVGPTAVGKTELVKVLASELFDTPDPLIRLDMSEYMEQHSVSKIIGSPPGYVGYDEAGQLTEKVRRKPYSVVLLDEIEKAHPNVLNIMLQILDEGKITDSHGRKVSFENTVIVMTSNAGSQFTDSAMGFNKTAIEISREKVTKSLNEFLRPEFLSRIDEIVVFSPLTQDNYADIAALMLDEIKAPLQEKDIIFGYTPAACKLIAEKSFGKKTGAREIRRVIRKEVEDKVAGLIIDDPDHYEKDLQLTEKDGNLTIITK